MKFIIDIDRTLTDDYSMYRGIKKHLMPELTVEEYLKQDFNYVGLLGEGEVKSWFNNKELGIKMFHSHDMLREGSIDVLERLKDMGVELHIVTHRKPIFAEITEELLADYRDLFASVVYTRGSKAEAVRTLLGESKYIAIDDAPDVIEDYSKCPNCVKAIKMKTGFNECDLPEKASLVNCWSEVIEQFKEIINI